MRGGSRRQFTNLLLAFLGVSWRTGSAQGTVPSERTATLRTQLRRYRADAAILLLGITILRIRGVGGGQASVEESIDGTSATKTLFFAAGSDPARAHGFDRLGWIREVVLESNSVPIEVQYFGVLTSSPEETLEHARKSIAAPASGHSTYSAVSGRHTAGESRSAITHFELAAGAQWSDKRLIDAAQATFQDKVAWRKTSWPEGGKLTPPTFLSELAKLLGYRAKQAVGTYVYNEQEYMLELTSPQAGKPRNATDRLVAVHGRIRNKRTNGRTTFTVWMDDTAGSIVPVRIEYQPRSFLRLVFEAV